MNWLAIGAHSDANQYAKKAGDVQNIAEDGSPVSVPSGWYLFEWEVWRKGNKTYHQDSVWVENGTVYELHY